MTPLMHLMHRHAFVHTSLALACGVLVGCGSMAGVGGSADYACKAPDGVKCDSVSGTYANALQNNLPGQRPARQPAAPNGTAPTRPGNQALPTAARNIARSSLMPASLRSEARILRLWIKPWEDSDGALHDQSYVYLQTDPGRWLVNLAQRQIREATPTVRPPRTVAAPADSVPATKAHLPSAISGMATKPGRPASNPADEEQ